MSDLMTDPDLDPVLDRTHWTWRIGVSLLAGLLIAALSLQTVMQAKWPIMNSNSLNQGGTLELLQHNEHKIKAFRARHHRLPKSLAELPKSRDDSDYRQTDTDSWNRPFVYTVRGEQYTLSSYGADGRPGGEGVDADLTPALSSRDLMKLAEPTFLQALLDPMSAGIRLSAIVCGVLTFLCSVWALQPREFDGYGIVGVVMKMVCVLIGASVVAMVVTVLHIPTGH